METNKKPENRPIYPIINEGVVYEIGMTLRDYFSNSAMQGMLSARMFSPADVENYAEQSYKIADAMLKQRELNND